jgi:hypothetical protein
MAEWTKERATELALECVQAHKQAEFEFLSNFLDAYCLEHPEDEEVVVRFLGAYTTAREIRAEHG